MKASAIFLWFNLLVLTACLDSNMEISGENVPMPIENEALNEGALVLSNLQAGQKSLYLGGDIFCNNGEFTFQHSGDTLIIEVLEQQIEEADPSSYWSIFQIKESAWGPNVQTDFDVIYPIYLEENKVKLPERENSALFFFYDSDQLNLTPSYNAEHIVLQSGCDLLFERQQETVFNGDIIAELSAFEITPSLLIGGEMTPTSSRLLLEQKAAVACRPINLEGNGYLIHDQHQLLLSYNYNMVDFSGTITTSGWGFVLGSLVSF